MNFKSGANNQRRQNGRHQPKGRQIDPEAKDLVIKALADHCVSPEYLIENLHILQDSFNALHMSHMAALAEVMGMPMAKVYEVASFYAHFRILSDGEQAPKITVRVCDGPACKMSGSANLLQKIAEKSGSDIDVVDAPCVGRCNNAPVVEVGQNHLTNANIAKVNRAIEDNDILPQAIMGTGYGDYRDSGGYRYLESCLAGEHAFEDIFKTLETSGLRGLGGAGFPSGLKWKFVRAEAGPRFVVVNADEGEPGTFKDRHILSTAPHRLLEGALIAAWAVGAADVYIYLRDEYHDVRLLLKEAIAEAENAGMTKQARIHLRRGAGAYICGEESSMLESIEGKRGIPRQKPPFPSQVGLFGRPTLIHNVETLYWIRDILEKGGDWYASKGKQGHKGLKHFSVSGWVKEPGVKLAPAGISVRDLIDEYCGGMSDGHKFKGYLPGGASGGIMPASLADVPLDFGTLEEHGCFIGSSAIVILSDTENIASLAQDLMRFFKDESCGQCTPCRSGTEKADTLMQQENWDVPLIKKLCDVMSDSSICGLGQAAPNPVRSLFRFFSYDVPSVGDKNKL